MKLILLLFIAIGAFADVNYLKKPFDENIQESFFQVVREIRKHNLITEKSSKKKSKKLNKYCSIL